METLRNYNYLLKRRILRGDLKPVFIVKVRVGVDLCYVSFIFVRNRTRPAPDRVAKMYFFLVFFKEF